MSASGENLPTFLAEFTEAEFQEFVKSPVDTMRRLGNDVDHFTINISDRIWLSSKQRWIAGSEFSVSARMPAVYVCSYSDSVCWCVRVV
jgi:hypothetical protein